MTVAIGGPTIPVTSTQSAAVAALAALTTGAVPVKTSGGYADSVYTNSGATLATATAAGTGWTAAGTFAPTSGSDAYVLHAINLTVNQTGGANGDVTALKVNIAETAAVGADYLCDYQIGGVSRWSIRGTAPITSSASVTWDAFKAAAFTQNFIGNTRINSLISKVSFYAPTLASNTATLTIDKACTVYIDGPPVQGANTSLTAKAALAIGSGNVGIGTTSPETCLHITGPYATDRGQLYLYTPSTSVYQALNGDANRECGFRFNSAGVLKWLLYRPANSTDLRFSDGSDRVTFQTGGNVGIGTTAPGGKLHVVATMTIASAAGAVFRGVYFASETVTISGSTNIDTSTGFNKLVVEAPTYSNASIAIAKAFTQRIDNAPQVTGGATITARGALLVSAGSIVCQGSALATNAAEGFLYIPSCAGTPTGTPQTHAGTIPMVYDSTNHKLYVYDGGWVGGTAPGAWS